MEPTILVTINGDTATDQQSIAEEFNNYFVNAGKSMGDFIESDKLSNKINPYVNSTNNSRFVLPCTKKCTT